MTSPAPAVTVGGLLKTRPDAFGLDLELLAGSGGLDRRITNPYVTFDAEAQRRRGVCVPASLRRAPETGEEA